MEIVYSGMVVVKIKMKAWMQHAWCGEEDFTSVAGGEDSVGLGAVKFGCDVV